MFKMNNLFYLFATVLFFMFSVPAYADGVKERPFTNQAGPAGIKAEPQGRAVHEDSGGQEPACLALVKDDAGAVYSVIVDTTFTQEKKLISSDGTAADLFGYSVAVNGDVAVVGARDIGAVYIYYRDRGGAGNWGQVKKLSSPDAVVRLNESAASDGAVVTSNFGYTVSVGGDALVVGAPGVNVGANVDQGMAYVYYRNQGGADNWGLVKKLTASDGAAGDNYGFSVSLSADTAVVGSVNAEASGNPGPGAAYVYYRNRGGENNWGEVKKLVAPDGVVGDLGRFVSLHGDVVVVGNNKAKVGGRANQGAAYVFYRNQDGVDNWGDVKKLTASDGAADDEFGYSGSVSGDTVVVGARQADVGGNADQGAAYVFSRNQGGTDNWGEVQKLTASDGAADDRLGFASSMSGDAVVIGANKADVDGQADAGAVYVFSRDPGTADRWGEVTKLTASDTLAGDAFGRAVVVVNGNIVTGACNADVGGNVDQGAAYVFVGPKLFVQKDGDGEGVVTDDLSGLDCGDDCKEAYMAGTQVTLTGTPDEGSALDGWTGPDCPGNGICRATVDRETTVIATFNIDTDGDGISDGVENAGPNNGDANRDGILDSEQPDVATFPDINGLWCTLLAEGGTTFKNVRATVNPSPGDTPEGLAFPAGFFGFALHGLIPGGEAVATLVLHETDAAMGYVRYGPSPDNTAAHWDHFLYDGATGVKFNREDGCTHIVYYFLDGQRGDDDLTADGVIQSLGGPATAELPGGGGGGSCFISTAP